MLDALLRSGAVTAKKRQKVAPQKGGLSFLVRTGLLLTHLFCPGMPSGISSNFVLRIFWCKYGRNKSISQPNPHASFFPYCPAERDNKGRDGATRGGRPRAQAEATSQSHKTPRRKQAGHPLDERLSPQIPKCSFKLNSDQLPEKRYKEGT